MQPEEQIKGLVAERHQSIDEYATFTHQKGDVRMITLTRDKLENILSASGSVASNFLTLMVGIALTIFMALRSGGVEAAWKATFWVAFYFSLILVVFFGILTAMQEWKKYQFKQELKPPKRKMVSNS
jgi:hypothetical protein